MTSSPTPTSHTVVWTERPARPSYATRQTSRELVRQTCAAAVVCGAAVLALASPASAAGYEPELLQGFAGSFQAPVIADFTGDGRADVATALASRKALVLLRGGASGIGPRIDKDTTPVSCQLVPIDLDGDVRSDLLTLGCSGFPSGQVRTYYGPAAGAFVTGPYVFGPSQAGITFARNVDADPQQEVIAFRDEGASLGALYDITPDPLSPAINITTFNADMGENVTAREIADVAGDARPEILAGAPVIAKDAGVVRVRTLPGGGRATEIADLPLFGRPAAIATGDISGDGLADIVVTTRIYNELTGFRRQADGSLVRIAGLVLPAEPLSVQIADVNGDGRNDVLTQLRVSFSSTSLLVLLNAGQDGFMPAAPIAGVGTPAALGRFAVGNVSGGAAPEIVATSPLGGGLRVYGSPSTTIGCALLAGWKGLLRSAHAPASTSSLNVRGLRTVRGAVQAIGCGTQIDARSARVTLSAPWTLQHDSRAALVSGGAFVARVLRVGNARGFDLRLLKTRGPDCRGGVRGALKVKGTGPLRLRAGTLSATLGPKSATVQIAERCDAGSVVAVSDGSVRVRNLRTGKATTLTRGQRRVIGAD